MNIPDDQKYLYRSPISIYELKGESNGPQNRSYSFRIFIVTWNYFLAYFEFDQSFYGINEPYRAEFMLYTYESKPLFNDIYKYLGLKQ